MNLESVLKGHPRNIRRGVVAAVRAAQNSDNYYKHGAAILDKKESITGYNSLRTFPVKGGLTKILSGNYCLGHAEMATVYEASRHFGLKPWEKGQRSLQGFICCTY